MQPPTNTTTSDAGAASASSAAATAGVPAGLPIPDGAYFRVPGLQSVLEAAYYGGSSGNKARQAAAAAANAAAPVAPVAPAAPIDRPSFPDTKADAASPFGPIAPKPYMKERALDFQTYLLFALAGAVGCAGTHSLVVPLDVVKTRKQTDKAKAAAQAAPRAPSTEKKGPGLLEGVQALWREEGLRGLYTGVEPTVLGYLFYGVTVRCSLFALLFLAAAAAATALLAGRVCR